MPPVGATVGVGGQVVRPAIYEARAERSVEDMLALAGGLVLIFVTLINQLVTRDPTLKSNMMVMAAERTADQIREEAEMVQALGMRGAAFRRWMQARRESLRGQIPPRLEHFLSGCSYDKALDFIEGAGC